MKVLIIGGVAAGATCAARLRRLDEHARIIIVERGEYVSFANCGLPYYIGDEIKDRSALTLATKESLMARYNIEVRDLCEAVNIDTERKCVSLKDLRTGEEYDESYDKLLLCPGARPTVPAISGTSMPGVFTLRTVPDAIRIKEYIKSTGAEKAFIIGGGYIGAEMAENLAMAGLKVTIAERSDHLIASLDFDIAAEVHTYLRDRGIRILLREGIRSIERCEDKLCVSTAEERFTSDVVILAVGVTPDTEFLRASGIELDGRGGIVTDSSMRTNKEDVYAAGDAAVIKHFITGKPVLIPLAGPANKEGRIVADNMCGIPSVYNGTQGTSVLKIFDMTVATTGLNENGAVAAGIDYDKTYTYSASHASYYPGAAMTSVKVLWDRSTHKIIGAQIVGGEGTDKRMDVIATAMRLGARVTDLKELELCYAPPFGSAKDPVNMVGFVAENVISGRLRQFFWDDVEALPRDGSVTLLDTRTHNEVKAGRIDGFINIPLNELRARINELPREKPVYVHCHSGLRSYIACMILSGHGYECYNLAGGWRLYDIVRREMEMQT